jgi:hypothetical protein
MVFSSLAIAVQSHVYDLHIPWLSSRLMIAVKFWAVQSDITPHLFERPLKINPQQCGTFR